MSCVNEQKARELLDRYFAGESTLDEEHALAEYLLTAQVPADLSYAQALFARHASTASATTTMAIASPRRHTLRRMVISLASVAAAAVVGTGIYLTVEHEHRTIYCYVNGIAVNDLDQIRQMTRPTFDKLDSSLTKIGSGVDAVESANRSIEQVEKAISMMTIK
ncbi:MAG: hypothetical protein SOZ00_01755 [Tidjanibacter sp.]|nr:hypothetical protein [Tidjanibacter sp.]